MEKTLTFEVASQDAGIRLDKYLGMCQQEFSRSFLQKLIEGGNVLIDGRMASVKEKTVSGAVVSICVPEPEPLEIKPEQIPLDILYEDKDLIVVNKGKDMVVHPAAGHTGGTLVNALLYHCKDGLSGINGVLRPGIVHRIDRNTTGVLVVCKNDQAHHSIAEQLKVHSITRKYEAIVHGNFKEAEGTVDAPIGRHPVERKKMAINRQNGKEAVTHYRLLENLQQGLAHIECQLETGRTHQIRVHMASLHHPLLGDDVYGYAADSKYHLMGQTLHAGVLGFVHPSTGEYMEFRAPLPEYFTGLLEKYRK